VNVGTGKEVASFNNNYMIEAQLSESVKDPIAEGSLVVTKL